MYFYESVYKLHIGPYRGGWQCVTLTPPKIFIVFLTFRFTPRRMKYVGNSERAPYKISFIKSGGYCGTTLYGPDF